MATVIITHKVQDYTTWRKFFDQDDAARTNAGFKIHGVYQAADDSNNVTIISEAPMDVLYAFMSRPEMKETMEKAGVISAPEVKVLNKAD